MALAPSKEPPRVEVAALAPPREPPRAVVPASTGLDKGQPVAAAQKAPEKKPVEPESFAKSSEGVVKAVFAPQGPWRGVVDRGSREYISWVQRSLNQLLSTDLDVDGVMGRRTRNVIRSFQRQVGIGVDGIVGRRTEDALIKAGASPTRAA